MEVFKNLITKRPESMPFEKYKLIRKAQAYAYRVYKRIGRAKYLKLLK